MHNQDNSDPEHPSSSPKEGRARRKRLTARAISLDRGRSTACGLPAADFPWSMISNANLVPSQKHSAIAILYLEAARTAGPFFPKAPFGSRRSTEFRSFK